MSTRLAITRSMLVPACATIVATIASFVTEYALCRWAGAQSSGPAIAAAVFSLGYGRRPQTHGTRALMLAPLLIACVALAALGVGQLLIAVPVAGASVFVIGMFLSVYARNYPGTLRRLGTVVALPLIVMLVVPATPAHAPGGPFVDIALGASAGVVSLVFATLVQTLVRRVGILPPAFVPEASAPAGRTGMTPATRMALQMAAALATAFVVGFRVFPGHWAWTVLTAFIVCSGARGRGDAAYKGVMRLLGAAGGTIVAALCANVWAPAGLAEAIFIFGLLFVALVLREINYAFWAAGSTLILALLARSADGFDLALLGTRLESILAGALCAVIAAWFVFPIRTEDVVRRRLADALKALDDLVVNAHKAGERSGYIAQYDRRMAELAGVAPPVRWHRRIFVWADASEHPARWIDLAGEICRHARSVAGGDVTDEKRLGRVRRAIGISRRAIGQHHDRDVENRLTIGNALTDLRDTLVTVTSAAPGSSTAERATSSKRS